MQQNAIFLHDNFTCMLCACMPAVTMHMLNQRQILASANACNLHAPPSLLTLVCFAERGEVMKVEN